VKYHDVGNVLANHAICTILFVSLLVGF